MNTHRSITLSQQINHAFLSLKGYDGFANIQSHDGNAFYDSYVHHNKTIASGITQQNVQITFIGKYSKGFKEL